MLYIETNPAFLTENYQSLLIQTNDMKRANKMPPFNRNQLAVLKGKRYKAGNLIDLSNNPSKKIYTEAFEMFVLADTDINIIDHFMKEDYYKTMDLLPILRAVEIDSMYELLSKNSPTNFTKGGLLKMFKKQIELILVYYHKETAEKKYEHYLVEDMDSKDLSEAITKKDRLNYQFCGCLTKEELLNIKNVFDTAEREQKLPIGGKFFQNRRLDYSADLYEDKVRVLAEYKFYDYYRDSFNSLVEQKESKKLVEQKFNELANVLLSKIEKRYIDINNRKKTIPRSADWTYDINYLSCARLSIEQLTDINNLFNEYLESEKLFIEKKDYLIKEISGYISKGRYGAPLGFRLE